MREFQFGDSRLISCPTWWFKKLYIFSGFTWDASRGRGTISFNLLLRESNFYQFIVFWFDKHILTPPRKLLTNWNLFSQEFFMKLILRLKIWLVNSTLVGQHFRKESVPKKTLKNKRTFRGPYLYRSRVSVELLYLCLCPVLSFIVHAYTIVT